jgi:hypothetical protein
METEEIVYIKSEEPVVIQDVKVLELEESDAEYEFQV